MPKRSHAQKPMKKTENSPGLLETEMDLLASEAKSFADKQLGLLPRSVYVSDHIHSVSITMFGILSEAEKNAAKDRLIADLIAKKHTRAFKAVKELLETQATKLIKKEISGSSFFLDPESNCATILLSF